MQVHGMLETRREDAPLTHARRASPFMLLAVIRITATSLVLRVTRTSKTESNSRRKLRVSAHELHWGVQVDLLPV